MAQYKFETLQIHAGLHPDAETGARAAPIYQSSSFVFKNHEHAANLFALKELGPIYTRIGNPTADVVERRLAALEHGTAGLLLSSGQSAETFAVLNITNPGDAIVSSSTLYGGTHTLFHHRLKALARDAIFVPVSDINALKAAVTPRTKALYCETIGNPKLDTPDLDALAVIAKENKIPLIVDNTFAGGGYLCKPLEHGANVVLHSCTKWIGGHGTSIGGILIDGGNFDWSSGKFPMFTEPDPSYHGVVYGDVFSAFPPMDGKNVAFAFKARFQLLRDLGSAPSPFNAWNFILGLETLSLRMERHSNNAMTVAKFLESHKAVARVFYPGLPSHSTHDLAKKYLRNGFGGMVSCELKGGVEAGIKLINNVKLFSHLANVGDAKSLIIHPASTTHQQLTEEEQRAASITPGFVRLSVGLEHSDDLIADLEQALHAVSK